MLAHEAESPVIELAQAAVRDAVARIREMPPRSLSSVQNPTASLRELLTNAPTVTDFDEIAWSRAWAEVEDGINERDQRMSCP